MSPTDKQAIEKIKKGEINFFSQIVHRYTKPISTFIARKLFDKLETDDLVQNTFLSFYKAIERFNEDRPVLPYLYAIAKNELKMFYRAHKKTISFEGLQVAIEEERVESVNVDESLQSLSGKEQKALQWVYEGHSYKEIAKYLSMPLNTVRTLIRRARLRISKNQNEK